MVATAASFKPRYNRLANIISLTLYPSTTDTFPPQALADGRAIPPPITHSPVQKQPRRAQRARQRLQQVKLPAARHAPWPTLVATSATLLPAVGAAAGPARKQRRGPEASACADGRDETPGDGKRLSSRCCGGGVCAGNGRRDGAPAARLPARCQRGSVGADGDEGGLEARQQHENHALGGKRGIGGQFRLTAPLQLHHCHRFPQPHDRQRRAERAEREEHNEAD